MAIRYAVYAENNGVWSNVYVDKKTWATKQTAQKHLELFLFSCPGYDAEIRKIEVISEIEKLRADREKLIGALRFYAAPESYDPDKFLVLSDLMRMDLSETNHSRFTPGKLARTTLRELGEME